MTDQKYQVLSKLINNFILPVIRNQGGIQHKFHYDG